MSINTVESVQNVRNPTSGETSNLALLNPQDEGQVSFQPQLCSNSKRHRKSIKDTTEMIWNRIVLLASFLGPAMLSAGARSNEKVKISIQPNFHSIPMFAALEFGWFQELGLDVELSMYASGGLQVQDAVENKKAWDLGIAGSVPSVLAGAQGMKIVAINNDASATTKVYGAPGITEWPPKRLYDGIFAATADSTGELLLRKCLDAAGVGFNDNHVKEASQSDIIQDLGQQIVDDEGIAASFNEELSSYGSLWAPNTYMYEHSHPQNSEVVCSGRDVDFKILGGLIVREEYAEEKAEVIAKVLAAYLRGISLMQNEGAEDQVLDISRAFHIHAGDPIGETAMNEDLILRPLFNLDEQLDALNRNFANNYESELDKHYLELEEFLFDHNVIEKKYLPKEYITDEFIKMVSDNEELRAFSYLGAVGEHSVLFKRNYDEGLEPKRIAGIVLTVIGVASLLISVALCFVRAKEPSTFPVEGFPKEASAANVGVTSWRNEPV